MKLTKILPLIAALLCYGLAAGQEAGEEPSLDSGSIESQFEYIFKSSGN